MRSLAKAGRNYLAAKLAKTKPSSLGWGSQLQTQPWASQAAQIAGAAQADAAGLPCSSGEGDL